MKILVLRGGALGDLILVLPLLREIRKNYPKAEIELWGVFPQARLAMPEFVDRVERLDAAELSPLFVAGQMPGIVRHRLETFDLAVSLLLDPAGLIAQNLAAGERRVIGGSRRLRPRVHAVWQFAEVLGELGLTLGDPVPKLSVGPRRKGWSRLGFHLGSGAARKNWPVDRWIELTERLNDFFDDFLLVGGEADHELVGEFCARSRVRGLRILLDANLSRLAEGLNECRLFIGHDTGVTHLAAAVGTPTVALFGATDPDVWAPLGDHVRVVRSADDLMESIRVTDVEAEVSRHAGELRRDGVSAE
ncbi:MAG: glycosyltransferase family 9 protein [Verrucomicrobia bacterium]|nr:glycosyltransferase family 9 protein [Verrucomicrobiota bacterium]MBV8640179.1 glycosyltransferase family 9 protein [Verrucomicrobiota bacterium]